MSPHEKGPAWHSLYQFFFFFFLHQFYLFTFWLGLVFTSHGLSLGAVGRGYSSCAVEASHMVASHCEARALGVQASLVAALRLGRCSTWDLLLMTRGIFPDGDRTHVPLHWQANSNHWATREALSNSYAYSTNPISHIKTSIQENSSFLKIPLNAP